MPPMCGRFDQHTDPEIIAERFDVPLFRIPARGARPHYNNAPSRMIRAARLDGWWASSGARSRQGRLNLQRPIRR